MSLNLKGGQNERKNFYPISGITVLCEPVSHLSKEQKKNKKLLQPIAHCTVRRKRNRDCLAYFHISHAIKLFVLLIYLQKRIVLFPPFDAQFLAQVKPQ